MSFWGELKRRNVYKVGVAYAIVAWLLIQAAAIIFPHLNLPLWAVTLVIVILIIGLPIALLLAWAYEVTPEGIKRTKHVPLAESITHLTGKKLNYILAGLLVLAVAYILFNKYYLVPRMIHTKQVTVSSNTAKEAKKTIAVLPFIDLSPEKDQEYFVDGLSEELLNSLAQIQDLGVAARTSSFFFKGTNKKVQEIANELGVDHILEGSVRKAGNALRISAQLIRASDGLHLWSKTYDRELKDIFAVQEDIATAVANELKVTLGIDKSLKQLGGTDNAEAYALFLSAKGQFLINEKELALKPIEAAIELDPTFGLAWASKANCHIALADEATSNHIDSELDAALNAALRAIEIEPNLAWAYYMLGGYRRIKKDWIGAELAYRKALEIMIEPFWDYNESFFHYSAVGNFKKLNEFYEAATQKDPYNMNNRTCYAQSLFFSGDIRRAEEENERLKALLVDNYNNQWNRDLAGWIRIFAGETFSPNEIISDVPADEVAKEHINSPKEGLTELRQIYNATDNPTNWEIMRISLWAAYFGDPEFAMDALERARNVGSMNLYLIWAPIFRETRQLSRFKEYIKEIGLVDYWNKFGWPDICRQLDNGDFECD